MSDGRLSDMANLSWARNAVMEAAVREIEWESRQAATTPSFTRDLGGDFQPASSQSDSNASDHAEVAAGDDGFVDWPPSDDGGAAR